ncbi:hypothetical protein EYF80_063981 [Liparis tanakae]|uniref:Uncharacterized protein n=1 Tax=Liparis tanakae TaxID=230148 RepID=A0A4Z2EBG3_9TELE|nr:hypothetical protein EYF80_063981 [Liparis tanakae]
MVVHPEEGNKKRREEETGRSPTGL